MRTPASLYFLGRGDQLTGVAALLIASPSACSGSLPARRPIDALRGPLPTPPVCGTSGSRLWFPKSRLAFQKSPLTAQTWWAQVGSNHRHLACKAECGEEYAQLSAPVHARELRKPCPKMPSGAWGSLHGGSRKWFPEQSADYLLRERVRAWQQDYRSRTRRMAGNPVIAIGNRANGRS